MFTWLKRIGKPFLNATLLTVGTEEGSAQLKVPHSGQLDEFRVFWDNGRVITARDTCASLVSFRFERCGTHIWTIEKLREDLGRNDKRTASCYESEQLDSIAASYSIPGSGTF